MVEYNMLSQEEKIDVLLNRIRDMKSVIDDYRMILTQLAISSGWTDEQIGNVIGVDSERIENLR